MASVSAGSGSNPSSTARAKPGGVSTSRSAAASRYPGTRSVYATGTWWKSRLMVASVASRGASEASNAARFRAKGAASCGAALASAPSMAAATMGTRGRSYQRWGLGSDPVTWSTDAASTRRGCPPSAPRSDRIQGS